MQKMNRDGLFFLFLIFSSLTLLSNGMRLLNKSKIQDCVVDQVEDFIQERTISEDENLFFVLNLHQEPPAYSHVFINKETRKDVFGEEADDKHRGFMTSYIDEKTERSGGRIREFLQVNGLWKKWSDPNEFTFATSTFDAGNSRIYFQALLNKIFKASSNDHFKLVARTLPTEEGKDFFYYHKDKELEDLSHDFILLSYGAWRKIHGLNFDNYFCKGISKEFTDRVYSEGSKDEFVTFLVMNGLKEIVDDFAEHLNQTNFQGLRFKEDKWIYLGENLSMKKSAEDLYNFLETVIYDGQFRCSGKRIVTQEIFENSMKARNAFVRFYFKHVQNLIGERFLSFLKHLINRRAEEQRNKGEDIGYKKWIEVGVSDNSLILLSNYLKFYYDLKISPVDSSSGKSLTFGFIGHKSVEKLNVYDNFKLIGTISIEKLLEHAKQNVLDNKIVDEKCEVKVENK
jgi:hypothetical protein